jgi:hypothetical protein
VAFGIPVVVLIVLLGQERRVVASALRGALAGYQLLGHNKARSVGPGPLSAQPWFCPRGSGPRRSGAAVRGFVLGNSRDRLVIS